LVLFFGIELFLEFFWDLFIVPLGPVLVEAG
jgi:hypothetical protein